MTDLLVYGAGRMSEYFLPMMKKQYNVLAIFDSNEKKHGQEICGIQVQPIKNKAVAVCICIADVESALEALLKHSFSDILFLMGYEQYGYGVVFQYSQGRELKDIVFNSIPCNVLFADKWNIENATRIETQQMFDESKPRVFNLALFPDDGQVGGSMAACKNIRDVNLTYGSVANLFSVNTSCISIPFGYQRRNMGKEKYKQFESGFNCLCDGVTLYNHITSVWCRLLLAQYILQQVYLIFDFRNEDVFLLNDVRDVYAFARLYPDFQNVFVGYHEQGSLSSVMNVTGRTQEFYDNIQLECLHTFKNWIFPSYGTYSGFLATASGILEKKLNDIKVYTAYNGFTAFKYDKSIDEPLCDKIYEKRKEGRLIFISATFLAKNKGVERIPQVLHKIREVYKKRIYWILIGDGEKHNEVQDAIRLYLHKDEYLWKKERLTRQIDLFSLFSDADFYIMAHYVSVFDLSILQAMAYGCVPVLTNIGGNKELCSYQNGILIEISNSDQAVNILQDNDIVFTDSEALQSLKKKNELIVLSEFSNEKFIKGYAQILVTVRCNI